MTRSQEGQTTPLEPSRLPEVVGGKLEKGKINMKLQNLVHIVIGLSALAFALQPSGQSPLDGAIQNTVEGDNALLN
jgi:hypothetical protein